MATYTYRTSENQSWFDLATQLLNDSSKALELANLNGYSILVAPLGDVEIKYTTDDVLFIAQTEFDNRLNTIISTLPNSVLFVNSFSNDFNIFNEFI